MYAQPIEVELLPHLAILTLLSNLSWQRTLEKGKTRTAYPSVT